MQTLTTRQMRDAGRDAIDAAERLLEVAFSKAPAELDSAERIKELLTEMRTDLAAGVTLLEANSDGVANLNTVAMAWVHSADKTLIQPSAGGTTSDIKDNEGSGR